MSLMLLTFQMGMFQSHTRLLILWVLLTLCSCRSESVEPTSDPFPIKAREISLSGLKLNMSAQQVNAVKGTPDSIIHTKAEGTEVWDFNRDQISLLMVKGRIASMGGSTSLFIGSKELPIGITVGELSAITAIPIRDLPGRSAPPHRNVSIVGGRLSVGQVGGKISSYDVSDSQILDCAK